jgi:hypothetical protein
MMLPATRSDDDGYDSAAVDAVSMQRAAAADSLEGGGRSVARGSAAAAAAGQSPDVAVGCDALAREDPRTLVGARVVRVHNRVAYEGSVRSFEQHPDYGTLWRAYFPTDDQEEVLNALELSDALQLAAGGAPAVAAACAGAELVAPRTASAAPCAARGPLHAARHSKPLSLSLSPSSPSPQLPPSPPPAAPPAPAAPPPCAGHAQGRFKGVTPHHGRWRAQVHVRGQAQPVCGGLFDDAGEAARAYDAAARKLGIKSLNFPRPGTAEVQGFFKPVNRAKQPTQLKKDTKEAKPAASHLAPRKRHRDVHTVAAPPPPPPRSAAAKAPRMQPAAVGERCDASSPAAGAVDALASPPPVGAAQLTPPAAHDDGGAAADLVSFLRSIRPPLSQIDVIAAAASGLTLAHVDAIAAARVDPQRHVTVLADTAGALGIHLPGDRLLFITAALERVPRSAGTAGFGGSTNLLLL